MPENPYITLRTVIINGINIKAITGIKVFALTIPGTAGWKNDTPTIFIHPSGGSCGHNVDDAYIDFYLHCYGGNNTAASAMAVYDALRADLMSPDAYHLATTNGIVLMAEIDMPNVAVEPETGWPVVVAAGTAIVRPV